MKKLYDGNVLLMTALVATAVRDVVVFDGHVGIAQVAGEVGDQISVDTVGVYEFPVATADEVSVGTPLYWDESAGEATITDDSGSNELIGMSWGTKAGAVEGSVGIKIG